jgi:hypothetical protein
MKKKVKKLTLSDLAKARGGRASANDSPEWGNSQFEQGSDKIDLKGGKEAAMSTKPTGIKKR